VITPYPTNHVLDELPPMEIPAHVRLCHFLSGGVVCRWRRSIIEKRNSRTKEVLAAVKDCVSRYELERLLGRPQQVVTGAGYEVREPDSTTVTPDTVEHYLHKGIRVTIWFKDDRLVEVFGWPEVTPWDVVCRLGESGHPTKPTHTQSPNAPNTDPPKPNED